MSEEQRQPPLESRSLRDLSLLLVQDRFHQILCGCQQVLQSAIVCPIRTPITCDPTILNRLAWAVAFNVTGGDGAMDDGSAEVTSSCYIGRCPADMAIDVLLTRLAAISKNKQFSPLCELAFSVSCEQRGDWQYPSYRLIDRKSAEANYEFVRQLHAEVVVRTVQKKFKMAVPEAEVIAAEAWSSMFADYWSATARRRFLGLAVISTCVCRIAFFKAHDSIKPKRTKVGASLDAPDSSGRSVGANIEAGKGDQPDTRLLSEEFLQTFAEALRQIRGKAAVVAEMVWVQEMSAAEVGRALGVTDAAISQHMKNAREVTQKYMECKGFTFVAPRRPTLAKKRT